MGFAWLERHQNLENMFQKNISSKFIDLLILIGLSGSSCDSDSRNREVRNENSGSARSSSGNGVIEPDRIDPRVRSSSTEKQNQLKDLTSEWDRISHDFSGEELGVKQRELSRVAVRELGAGPELVMFLEYLQERGAGDVREWLLNDGLDGLFAGTDAEAARRWLLVVEDEELRTGFLRQAGEEWTGPGFKDYFNQWDWLHHGQAQLLTGYCASLAKSDALGAMRLFKELCIPKRISYDTLDQVILNAPPDSKFLEMAGFFDEDDRPLAKTSRRAVLAKWAETSPKDAAQYVIGNTATVHADQMEVVVTQWARKSVPEATQWLNALSAGLQRDHGMRGLAEHLAESDPARAFVLATMVGDVDLKLKTATEVFQEWAKTDRAAAEAAWLEATSGKGAEQPVEEEKVPSDQ
jgi:hypothetical protein